MPSKIKKKLKEQEFYCLFDRDRVKAYDIGIKLQKNSKGIQPVMKGICNKCGTNVNKFIKKDLYEYYVDKYGSL